MKVLELDPESHVPSPLHEGDRDWRESNCYVDVWLELLNALDLDARPCLGFALSTDFEGDQWTFHKPVLDDLHELYGVVVDELNLWKGLVDHCRTQVELGRFPLLEVDSFYLPDTELSGYHDAHGKTTIAVNYIDADSRHLEYFHNCGYYELNGRDFDGLFRLDDRQADDRLAPYCEIVKVDRLVRLPEQQLRATAGDLLRKYVDRAPRCNPFHPFSRSLQDAIGWLIGEPEAMFHAYMFASLRQCGSAFELSARHLSWLDPCDELAGAARELSNISTAAMRLVMKAARMVQRGREQDVGADVAFMADSWERAFHILRRRVR